MTPICYFRAVQSLLAYFRYVEKIKVVLWDHLTVCVSVFVSPSRQRLGKHVPAATNTHATTEELLYALFSMPSFSYQRKLGY
jgi:hypothetical protein